MLSELRTFLAVVRFGSFAKAGDNIGLTQGAVSAQIRRLEEQIGVELFDRSGRRAALTPEGREIHSRAEDIVASIMQLGTPGRQSAIQGVVTLGAITSVQQTWLIDTTALILKEFPSIGFRVIPGDSFRLFGQVDAGEIDMAVMVRPPFGLQGDLRWFSLVHESFALLAPSTFTGSSWEEAAHSLPFIRYERSSFGGRVVDQFLRKVGLHIREVLEMDEIDALIRAVELGIGFSIIPLKHKHTKFIDKIRIIPLNGPKLTREIGVVARVNGKHQLIIDRFIELLQYSAV